MLLALRSIRRAWVASTDDTQPGSKTRVAKDVFKHFHQNVDIKYQVGPEICNFVCGKNVNSFN